MTTLEDYKKVWLLWSKTNWNEEWLRIQQSTVNKDPIWECGSECFLHIPISSPSFTPTPFPSRDIMPHSVPSRLPCSATREASQAQRLGERCITWWHGLIDAWQTAKPVDVLHESRTNTPPMCVGVLLHMYPSSPCRRCVYVDVFLKAGLGERNHANCPSQFMEEWRRPSPDPRLW